MSREHTPREKLAAEKTMIARGGPSIWDDLEHTTIHCGSESYPSCSAEELELRKQYELIGKLIDHFAPLHSELQAIKGGLSLLSKKETELKQYVEHGKGDESSYVIQWYNGKLDTNFYRAERNHELFRRRLISEAHKEAKGNV